MRHFLLLVIVLILFSTVTFGEKLATLEGLSKPGSLAVDPYYPQFYVTEEATIFIYSLADFKLKTKFGKAGEGPQEFHIMQGTNSLVVQPLKDSLLINSMRRVSFFSKEGKFIKELSTGAGFMSMRFQPIGNGYAGLDMALDGDTQSMAFTLNLYDGQFNKTKQIQKMNLAQRGKMQFPMVAPSFYAADEKIIALGGEDFAIDVYNSGGNKLTSISREYKKIEVTEEYKKGVHDFYKSSPNFGQFYESIKNMFQFSNYFPAIQTFLAADQKIYIQTYLKEEGGYEFFIYDLEGKFLKRLFLPVVYRNSLMPFPYTIMHNKLYQLIENEAAEVWELHAVAIDSSQPTRKSE